MQKTSFSTFYQVLPSVATILAYWVLHYPEAHQYSLQIFSLGIILFFVTKRLGKAKLWHILPAEMTIELAILKFSFLFLIGATGLTHSPFFFLIYILLFFLVMSSTFITAISGCINIIIFIFALESVLGLNEIEILISLPALLFIFLFTKKQYDEVQLKQLLLEDEGKELDKSNRKKQTLEVFIDNFLKPKLNFFSKLLEDPAESKETVKNQIDLTITELDKALEKVAAVDQPTDS